MANEFADKELRVIVSQNGVLINNYNEETRKYTEKTKVQKIESVLAMIASGTLINPNTLQQDVTRQLSRMDSVTIMRSGPGMTGMGGARMSPGPSGMLTTHDQSMHAGGPGACFLLGEVSLAGHHQAGLPLTMQQLQQLQLLQHQHLHHQQLQKHCLQLASEQMAGNVNMRRALQQQQQQPLQPQPRPQQKEEPQPEQQHRRGQKRRNDMPSSSSSSSGKGDQAEQEENAI